MNEEPTSTEASPASGRGKAIAIAAGAALVGVLVGVGAVLLLRSDGDVVDVVEAADPTTTSITETTEPPTTETPTTSPTTAPTTVPEGQIPPGSMRYLSEFDPVDVGSNVWSFDTGQGSLSGTVYARSLMLDPGRPAEEAFVEYDLGRNFSRLEGFAGLRDDAPSDLTMHLEIFGDGERLFDEISVMIGTAIPVDLDITDVLRLRIQVTDLGERNRGFVEGPAIFADFRVEP